MSEVEATTTATRTRPEVTKRSFSLPDGSYVGRSSTRADGFRIELIESGQVFEHKLKEFSPEVIHAAALFGIVTSVTNAIGGKGLSVEERGELLENRLATFLEGEWASERESGPRSSQLLEAIVQVRADNGKDSSQEWRDAMSIKLKDDQETRNGYMNNPLVRAALEKIKADAAAKRAAAAAAKAGESKGDLADILAD